MRTAAPSPPEDDEFLLPALPGEVCGLGRLKRIITKFPSEPLEVIGALGMTALGLWLLLPMFLRGLAGLLAAVGLPTFTPPSDGLPTGGVLTNVRLWGWGLLLLSIYKWWATLWGYQNRLHRLFAAGLAGTGYFLILTAYIRRAPRHVVIVVMLLWIIHQCWIAYRSQKTWRSHK